MKKVVIAIAEEDPKKIEELMKQQFIALLGFLEYNYKSDERPYFRIWCEEVDSLDQSPKDPITDLEALRALLLKKVEE